MIKQLFTTYIMNQHIRIITTFLCIPLICACTTSQIIVQPVVKVIDQANLINSKKEMRDSAIVYRFPFEIENNDKDASLKLDFIVNDTGHCQTTYTPTTVSVNNQRVKEIDFREFEFQSRHIIDIPIKRVYLMSGRNQIEIITGECSYDIDDMVMNEMKIELD